MKMENFRFTILVSVLLGFIFLGAFTEWIWNERVTELLEYSKEKASLEFELVNIKLKLTAIEKKYTYMPEPERPYQSPMNLNDFREYTSPFGIRLDPTKDNVGGMSQTNHTGQDMKGTPDALAEAVGIGIVKHKYYSRGWHKVSGKMKWFDGHSIFDGYVIIEHPNGDESLYGHLDEIYVYEKQQVKAGDPIGRVSQKLNGKTTGPHLHFALRNKDGTYLSPFRYIKMPKEIL